jgi:hypothetical protein
MKRITEKQLQEYAEFPDDGVTDFVAYRDCAIMAREILRLRRIIGKRGR